MANGIITAVVEKSPEDFKLHKSPAPFEEVSGDEPSMSTADSTGIIDGRHKMASECDMTLDGRVNARALT